MLAPPVCPIVVALNKIDKDNANPERVKQQLSDAGLVPEDWGGKHSGCACLSQEGHRRQRPAGHDSAGGRNGHSSRPIRTGRPSARLWRPRWTRSRGPLATVLVQHGTLNVGDYVVVGSIYGKIRAMFNDKGKAIRKATPSTPASILGLSDVPQSGDILRAVARRADSTRAG